MTAMKVAGAALLGLIAGYILSGALLYPLFLAAEGGRDMNGGIAMGVFFGLAPVGAIVGAITGAAWVLRRARRETGSSGDTDASAGV
jgi:hypothetical protein